MGRGSLLGWAMTAENEGGSIGGRLLTFGPLESNKKGGW